MSKGRVIVAMSGGVDSSVAAALLKNQGYEVIGVYILGWPGEPDFPCNWQQEEADAKAVARKLGIDFHSINLAKEYQEEVVDQFFAGYRAGVTPNPDILCNREIKFKALWQAVRQFEPDYLATGHYVRMGEIKDQKSKIKNVIEKGKDQNKDQSYFLWGIDKNILPHLLFPIGDYKKSEVRKLAEKFKLSTAKKKDSQGICFIGPLKVRDFLRRHVSTKPGDAVLTNGRVIARHEGSQFYTIGQRLAPGSVDWTGDAPPLYVLAKDLKRNLVIVGSDSLTYSQELTADRPNWLISVPVKPFVCQAKIRYRQKDVTAKVELDSKSLSVRFNQPVRAITSGQSIVFFNNETLLGGAIITTVPNQERLVKTLNKLWKLNQPAQPVVE